LLVTLDVVGGCDKKLSQPSGGSVAGSTASPPPSNLHSDEDLVLYPTAAHFDPAAGKWVVPVHGNVHEPETDSIRRNAVVDAIRRSVGVEEGSRDGERLESRVRGFMVDNERGKRITVQLGETRSAAGTSGPDGHFRTNLLLDMDAVAELKRGDEAKSQRQTTVSAVLPADDSRSFAGRVEFVPEHGLSVVSDIDDTIKHTQVRDRPAMVANTFVRAFQAVPGMAALYQQWAERGCVFHYVSGSPWQLYQPLSDFLRDEQFPEGSMDLKLFRLKDPSALDMLSSQTTHKIGVLEPLLSAFPLRRFVLVGDSGEQDPEIYAEIARTHRTQVVAICIRNVTNEKLDNERIRALRPALAETPFLLFDKADEVGSWMDPIMSDTEVAQ
jgi:phosphatidate phosphatase APP1